MIAASLTLGAPGVYTTPEPLVHTLTGVRMDVAGFVGVAPRGPARVPVVGAGWEDTGAIVEPDRPRARSVAVAVEGWDDYVRLFGAYEGPGRLAPAVATFFQQGGRRAHVVRIVHDYGPGGDGDGGVAAATLAGVHGTVTLRARSEGLWGNGLRAQLSYVTRPLLAQRSGPAELAVDRAATLAPGTLLRLTVDAGVRTLSFVEELVTTPRATSRGSDTFARLEHALAGTITAIEVVEATLTVTDGDGRAEQLTGLGLDAAHPRWLGTVLCRSSQLLWPDPAWRAGRVRPGAPDLRDAATGPFGGGRDRYDDIVHDDFFDPHWVPGMPPDLPLGAGVHALLDVEDLAVVVVPDLYEPAAFEPDETVFAAPPAGATFERCVAPGARVEQAQTAPRLAALVRDPLVELDVIVGLQAKLVELAEQSRAWIVLLDVPPGLDQRAMLRWRASFDSMWAAGYHPWLTAATIGSTAIARIPPSAAAAGIIARSEWAHGIPRGASNELVAGIVDVEDHVDARRHDELHLAGVDVFLRERAGVRLTAARTLSRDPQWRQLSVRRVVSMIERALLTQMQWAVFEPNSPQLGATVRHMLENFLDGLYRANAFAGATSAQAFFVHYADSRADRDAGRFVVDVGVAPVEPLEYIVVRLTRGGDGTLIAEAGRA